MYSALRNKCVLAGVVLAVMMLPCAPVSAYEWDRGFQVWVVYEGLTGADEGCANVVLTMNLPMGTPLLAREAALDSALQALRDIWNVESVHDDIRGFLEPNIPQDVQDVVSEIEGAGFIIAVMDAFETVADAGYSRFQGDVSVTATEHISIPGGRATQSALARVGEYAEVYPDAPRYFEWIVGGGLLAQNRSHENWVIASLVNYSAAILCFRSEFGRFPQRLAELRERGHLLIEPLNPYTTFPVQVVDHPSPGDITYEYVDSNTVAIITYLQIGSEIDFVRRQISLSSTAGSFDLLYRETAGLSENDKQVARYVFQISQILNEYYYQYNDLPYDVPQCEAAGFAYVSFPNPFTGRDASQADSLANIYPGDYTYNRISSTEYFLVGYGQDQELILRVGKDFGATQVPFGSIRAN